MADAKTSFSLQVLVFLLLIYSQKIECNDLEELPNVILLVVDNLGFSDVGYFGNTTVKTPNIDRLAGEGVRFTRWYSQSSSTSTRASILTGRLPIQTGILKSRYLPYKAIPSLASNGGLHPDQITIAEVLKAKGYETAFVGQWGMGLGRKNSFSPMHQGFDHWYGVPTLHNKFCIERTLSNDTDQSTLLDDDNDPEVDLPPTTYMYLVIVSSFTIILGGLTALWLFKKIDMMMFVCLAAPEVILLYLVYFSFNLMDFVSLRNCVLYRNGKIIEQPYVANNMTLRFTRETLKILNDYSTRKSPFFIMQSYLKMHKPLYVSDAFSNCSENDLFLCSLLELDWSIGKIISTLNSLEKENDTLVILTSTGGPCVDGDCTRGSGILVSEEQIYEEFRSGGNNVWEGDTRVPTIIRWKQKIQPGQTINVTTSCMDILPTIMDLTNQSLEGLDTDGKSLVPLLGNSSAVTQHPMLYHYTDVYKPSAVTQGKYKFVFVTQSDGITLYHDPPLVFNIEADLGETTPMSLDEFPETLLAQVLSEVEQHLANRTDKGTSQFDNFFLPWLFPCVNMPSCLQVNKEKDDFSKLFLDNTDDTMFQRHDDDATAS